MKKLSGSLLSCTSKSTASPAFPKLKNKISDDDRDDDQLPNPGIFQNFLFPVANVADDRVDLAPVTGINGRQFTGDA